MSNMSDLLTVIAQELESFGTDGVRLGEVSPRAGAFLVRYAEMLRSASTRIQPIAGARRDG